jgi:hypothetical protein
MIPVISTITSILGYAEREFWVYQPAVTQGAPVTEWSWSGLPPGVTVNTSTGAITGPATNTGVYLATVTATNSSGTASLVIPIGIFAAGWQQQGAIAVDVDLNTGVVTPIISGYKDGSPVIYGQEGATLMIDVGFTQNAGVSLIPLYPSAVAIALKQFDSEAAPMCASDGTFQVLGSYQSTRYRLLLPLTGDLLASALSDNEQDKGTLLTLLGEIRWEQPIDFNSEAKLIPRSSLTFSAQVGKALAA